MLVKILRNINKDFGECSTRFRRIFKKNPGNVQEGSGGMFEMILGICSRRFRGIFEKIPGNLNSPEKIFLCYYL